MDTSNTPPHGPAPGSHASAPHRPVQPMARRPMVDGFAPRRPIRSTPDVHPSAPVRSTQLHPTRQSSVGAMPQASPAGITQQVRLPGPAPQPHPAQPANMHPLVRSDFSAPTRAGAFSPALAAKQSAVDDVEPPTTSRPGREKNRTGHAGLAGLAAFILLGALLLSPFVPGKIVENFPFASSGFSTGDQSLDCLGTQGNITSATRYDRKAGAPITYTYSTSTTQSATCNGQTQHAVAGHTSQFNPLGLVIDVVAALAVAIALARVWWLIFGEKKHTPRRRDETG